MSGVLASDNTIQIFRVGEFSLRRKWNAAVECGPFLVDHGAAVRELDNTRSARRTFAAVDRRDHVAVGLCSEVSLAEIGAEHNSTIIAMIPAELLHAASRLAKD